MATVMSSVDFSILLWILMKELNILNVYQINILKHLSFMFKVKNNIIPRAFNQVFSLIYHIYPLRLSDKSFKICDFNLKLTHFAIGFKGPTIWNKFPMESEKSAIAVFKNKNKENILDFLMNFYFLKFILLPVILFSYFINQTILFVFCYQSSLLITIM